MGALADFRVCLFDPLKMRVEGPLYTSSLHVRLGTRGFNLAKKSSVLLVKPNFQNPGKSLVSQRQRRLCPKVLDSADDQKSPEVPQVSRTGEVVTLEAAQTNTDTQNGATSRQSDSQLLSPTQVAAYRSDPVRSRLLKKLSEANQFNRHLLRQVAIREKVIQQSKHKISELELELGVLVKIAQEIAQEGGKPGTRKINGRYVHSHMAVRLEELHQTLLKQLEIIEGVRSREVEIIYYGMAENITVMGTFDNWSHGEAMSPEMTGSFTKFTATLKLLPGRYEIKFMVDGEWRLSNFLPIMGEGLTMNNLLVVD